MAVIVELPDEVEQRLRAVSPNLDREAKVALLVEMYRQEKLSRHELAIALSINRMETDALLKLHNVTEDLPSLEDMEDDLRQARRMLER